MRMREREGQGRESHAQNSDGMLRVERRGLEGGKLGQ